MRAGNRAALKTSTWKLRLFQKVVSLKGFSSVSGCFKELALSRCFKTQIHSFRPHYSAERLNLAEMRAYWTVREEWPSFSGSGHLKLVNLKLALSFDAPKKATDSWEFAFHWRILSRRSVLLFGPWTPEALIKKFFKALISINRGPLFVFAFCYGK